MRKLILLVTLAAFSWCVTPVMEAEAAPYAIAKAKHVKKHHKKKKKKHHRKHRRHRRKL